MPEPPAPATGPPSGLPRHPGEGGKETPAALTCDAVVVGGGPAGSSAAAFLARAGRDVVLLERQRFPRFHIGESMLPASNEILRDLGVAERVAAAGFVRKRGASFWTEDCANESYVDFSRSSEVAEPVTYQVPRDRFDQILLDNATASGVRVLAEHRAVAVELEDDRAHLQYSGSGGRAGSIEARVLVDASGQAGFLAKRLQLRQVDRRLCSVAEHAQFEGIPPLAGDRAGDIRIISLRDMGWIWLIPLSDEITSVGVVAPRQAAGAGKEPGGLLRRFTLASPSSVALFGGARQVSEARRDADYSYRPKSYVGSSWLLAGDAGSFLDPVFSTGVLLALRSGREAAAAVHRALAEPARRQASFAAYDRSQRRAYRFFRRMAVAFYDPAFRDVMFQPGNPLGILDAVTATLAGNATPSLRTRARLQLLFLIVGLHRRLGITGRLHGAGKW